MKAGGRQFKQGKLGNAVQSFTSATELQPNRAEGWVNLGSALLQAKRYEHAVAALHKAVVLSPGLMPAHLVLGDALRMLGKWQEAFCELSQCCSAATHSYLPEQAGLRSARHEKAGLC